ncbi:hypothetical protein [Pantoea eucrina]
MNLIASACNGERLKCEQCSKSWPHFSDEPRHTARPR